MTAARYSVQFTPIVSVELDEDGNVFEASIDWSDSYQSTHDCETHMDLEWRSELDDKLDEHAGEFLDVLIRARFITSGTFYRKEPTP